MTDLSTAPSRRNKTGQGFVFDAGAAAIDELLAEVEADRKAKGQRSYGTKTDTVRNHIRQIVADLYAAWIQDPKLAIGFSRKSSAFRKGGAYHGIYTEDIFITVVDTLAEAGYIETMTQDAGFKATSSRMRATKKLIGLLQDAGVNWASIIISPGEDVLRLKSAKDKNGSRKRLPFNDEDNPSIPSMKTNLERINEVLSRTLINLAVSDEDQAKINERLRGDPDERSLDFTRRHLYRVFDEDWTQGGRFYGGWWQGVPSEYRKHVRIEGKLTVELDYSAIHPSILYAEVGVNAPEDAYQIPGWDKKHRGLIKKAFNQMLNSSDKTKPKTQWRNLGPDLVPDQLPDGWDDMRDYQKTPYRREAFKQLTGKDYDELLSDIIDNHDPIAHNFFTKAWGKLQKIDSDIAEQVMLELLYEGIVALPIHDSFIVRRGFEQDLKRAMNKAYRDALSVNPKIKKDHLEPPKGGIVRFIDGSVIRGGEELYEDIMDKHGRYNLFETRNGEWTKQWGLEGQD